jgi:hypothetical protein
MFRFAALVRSIEENAAITLSRYVLVYLVVITRFTLIGLVGTPMFWVSVQLFTTNLDKVNFDPLRDFDNV